jgi:hypothetical protein
MSMDVELQICNGLKWADVKIMAQASVFLRGEPAAVVGIRRGMKITSSEGREAGKVAGVAIRQDSRKAVCLILSHLPEEACYQSLPVGWIERVEGETIVLNASFESILATPGWHAMGA